MTRVGRNFLYAFIVLIFLLIGLRFVGWWIFHRGLPQLDGTHEITELKSEVTVLRDAKGVPHIRGQSREDLCVAQGYVMAQDRLWQMDLVRRAAGGRLSEIIGPQTVEIDRSFRRLGLSEAADREVSLLDVDERTELEAFARGVNRYISEKHPLPVEFTLLRYDPEPWRPADTLLVIGYMYQTLTSSWRWDLNRLEVSARIGKERAAFFYDQTSPFDHPIVGAQAAPTKAASRKIELKQAATSGDATNSVHSASVLDRSDEISKENPAAIWSFARDTLFQFDEQVRAAFGSNNWVVDGTHTASGKPLLANDTHLSLSTPSIWYLVQLSIPGWNAEGFTLPGVPGIVIGHNDQIAWGFTNDGADVQDLYAETFNPANSLEYRVNNQWVAAQDRKEIINVKGQPAQTLDVIVTRHGPVMSQQGSTGYALKWTATEPGGLAHSYFRIQFAHNWNEFRESLRDAAGPGQNIVYADVEGHIGFIVAARIPIRKCPGTWPPVDSPLAADTPCGAAPMPGDTDAFEWSGYIPFDELPQVLDPPGGIIATANARVAGPAYPHFMTANWMTPWRVDRIFKLLGEPGKKFTPEDFNTIQNDIVSELDLIVAKELLKAAASAKPIDERTGRLIQMLANWDGQMKSSSVEATFVEQTERALGRNLFHPYLGDALPSYPRGEVFLERVLRERPAMWLPQEFHSYDDFLIASADLAVAELTTSSGQTDFNSWTWGKRNSLFMAHALGQTGLLARIFSIGPVEQSGATGCIKAMGSSYGPSMRMVADTSNWDHSLMEITTGESGQVSSDYYRDQFPDWFAGQSLPAPFSDAVVGRVTSHTLHLVPGH